MEEGQKLTKKERRALAKEEKRKEREKQEKSRTLRKLVVGMIILGVLAFSGYRIWQWINTPTGVSTELLNITEEDWVKGNPDAHATLIEYSDFECLACKYYYEIVDRLNGDYSDDLRIVYRHFPLETSHPNAKPAAIVAEAAGKQGMFWEMHDKLFDKQDDWSDDDTPEDKFRGYAEELGLDLDRFDQDYESDEVENKVDKDLVTANQLRLNHTPTFFLNGEEIQPQSYDEFKELVETEIRGYSLKE